MVFLCVCVCVCLCSFFSISSSSPFSSLRVVGISASHFPKLGRRKLCEQNKKKGFSFVFCFVLFLFLEIFASKWDGFVGDQGSNDFRDAIARIWDAGGQEKCVTRESAQEFGTPATRRATTGTRPAILGRHFLIPPVSQTTIDEAVPIGTTLWACPICLETTVGNFGTPFSCP